MIGKNVIISRFMIAPKFLELRKKFKVYFEGEFVSCLDLGCVANISIEGVRL